MRKIFGNLWFWVVLAFLLVIGAWVWTIKIASKYPQAPIEDGETLEQQAPSS